MDFDNDFPLRPFGELYWLDVRIDHGPLACPVATHSLASVDVTAFHSICPDDLLLPINYDSAAPKKRERTLSSIGSSGPLMM